MAHVFDDLPACEPITLRAGDTLIWRRADLAATYAPADYGLDYVAVLETDAATRFTLTAANVESVFEVTATPLTTASYTAGLYHWTATLTRLADNAKRTIDQGRFEVLPDLSAASGDQRSHNERMLDQLEAVLEGRAKSDAASYEIAGRKITKLSPQELMDWAARYRRLVRQETERRTGKAGRTIIKPRFL